MYKDEKQKWWLHVTISVFIKKIINSNQDCEETVGCPKDSLLGKDGNKKFPLQNYLEFKKVDINVIAKSLSTVEIP